MGNSLRCCLACILPCGPLDVIRIAHINGQVDQYSRPITAAEILTANPNHVLSKPCFDSTATVRRIVKVTPDTDLKRGNIYFLIPNGHDDNNEKKATAGGGDDCITKDDGSFRLPEKRIRRQRRSKNGRVGVLWRHQLESIVEDEFR